MPPTRPLIVAFPLGRLASGAGLIAVPQKLPSGWHTLWGGAALAGAALLRELVR